MEFLGVCVCVFVCGCMCIVHSLFFLLASKNVELNGWYVLFQYYNVSDSSIVNPSTIQYNNIAFTLSNTKLVLL